MAERDDTGDHLEIDLWVQPGARRPTVGGRHGGALRVAVAEPPERGRATEAVLGALAAALGVARRDVELVRGARGRAKRVRVHTDDAAGLRKRLDALLERE